MAAGRRSWAVFLRFFGLYQASFVRVVNINSDSSESDHQITVQGRCGGESPLEAVEGETCGQCSGVSSDKPDEASILADQTGQRIRLFVYELEHCAGRFKGHDRFGPAETVSSDARPPRAA